MFACCSKNNEEACHALKPNPFYFSSGFHRLHAAKKKQPCKKPQRGKLHNSHERLLYNLISLYYIAKTPAYNIPLRTKEIHNFNILYNSSSQTHQGHSAPTASSSHLSQMPQHLTRSKMEDPNLIIFREVQVSGAQILRDATSSNQKQVGRGHPCECTTILEGVAMHTPGTPAVLYIVPLPFQSSPILIGVLFMCPLAQG